MNYLTIRNLHKSFSHKIVFEDLHMTINAGQKVALVAANGAGKTTLLRTITGEETYPEGVIQRSDKITMGVLSQETKLDPDLTVLDTLFDDSSAKATLIKQYEHIINMKDFDQKEYETIVHEIDKIDAWSYESRVRTIIAQLQLTPYLEQKVSTLSGGEEKRIALAKVLIDEPDFLLLDEPTNHLDVEMIEWLEAYIKRHDLTLLMVTHDRYFLESVCTDIYELEAGVIHRYPGNYSFFLHKKAERDSREASELHEMRQLYKKELTWMRTAPRARGSKSVYRQKQFYDQEQEFKTARKKFHTKSKGLELSILQQRLGGKIMKVENMQKSFGKKVIADSFTYEFQHGERIGIVGANGAGKSTFINMLLGKEPMDHGHVVTGKTVVFGHYMQTLAHFDPEKTVLDTVKAVAEYIKISDGSKLSATRLLERFMFPPKQQHSFVRFLSGGEKRRLSLLLVLLKNPNFLILDEPTNDLDIYTIQVLEQFLLAYNGCLIVISHDRFFMDKIVDHLFVFEGEGKIRDFRGSYTDYKRSLSNASSTDKDSENNDDIDSSDNDNSDEEGITEQSDSTSANINPKLKKLSYIEQREFDALGPDIEKLENEKILINQQFQDPSTHYDTLRELGEQMKEIVAQLEEKEMRWLELLDKIG